MQQEHKVAGATAISLLLDAPDPWRVQLISGQYLDGASKLSLFQTCRLLNELVMQHSKSTSLKIGMHSMPRHRALKMLQEANKHAQSVELTLSISGICDSPADDAAHIVYSFLQEAAQQGATSALSELQLQRMELETILPPAIGQACPNMIRLVLDKCTIHTDSTVSCGRTFQHLRYLQLVEYYFKDPEDSYTAEDSDETENSDQAGIGDVASDSDAAENSDEVSAGKHETKPQLSSLPALRSLSCVCDCQSSPAVEQCSIIINAAAAQLTHLCFDLNGVDPDDWTTVEDSFDHIDWVKLGGTLQHVQLINVGAGDDAMKIFLKMPSLKLLELAYFQLEESFAGQPCTWEELFLRPDDPCYYGQMELKTLAYLPLHPGLLLKVDPWTVDITAEAASSGLLQRAVANVQHAKALEWDGMVQLSLPEDFEAPEAQQAEWLEQALPIVRCAKHVAINSCTFSGAIMKTLCDFVQSRQDGTCLRLGRKPLGLDDAITLVRHMPHDSSIDLGLQGEDVEEQVIRVCCAAQHKLTLHVGCRGGQEQRIRSALQAKGLEVISLGFQYGTNLKVTVQPCNITMP